MARVAIGILIIVIAYAVIFPLLFIDWTISHVQRKPIYRQRHYRRYHE